MCVTQLLFRYLVSQWSDQEDKSRVHFYYGGLVLLGSDSRILRTHVKSVPAVAGAAARMLRNLSSVFGSHA
jgi:hypothetical protein